jgi:CheY-like chemotaxis protein
VDGASAVEETTRLKPQLVLLDVQLPDIDGFDVAARITGKPIRRP